MLVLVLRTSIWFRLIVHWLVFHPKYKYSTLYLVQLYVCRQVVFFVQYSLVWLFIPIKSAAGVKWFAVWSTRPILTFEQRWSTMMDLLTILAVPLLLVCVSAENTTTLVVEQEVERKILVALFQYTNGASWTQNDNWNDPQVHYCDWHGIQCIDTQSSSRRQLSDGKYIESIDLSENNLKGSVPISLLLLLPNIRSVRLNGNNVDLSILLLMAANTPDSSPSA